MSRRIKVAQDEAALPSRQEISLSDKAFRHGGLGVGGGGQHTFDLKAGQMQKC